MIITYYCAITMIIIAYLLGSIPSAVWIGKRYYGIDIREHGSKNAGTTNMLRVLGKRAAMPVFAIDFIKGFVAVTIMSLMKYDENISQAWLINLKIIATAAVVLGHIFPVFANFKGGKGVATLVGAVTGINPEITLLCFGIWFIVFMVSHYVSLASMTAGCCFPILVGIFSGSAYKRFGDTSVSFIVFSIVVALLLLWTHRKNIERLRKGTESKIYLWKPRHTTVNDKETPQHAPETKIRRSNTITYNVMLQNNLIKMYESSFRENREMSALTDYFKNETFSYYEMAKEIAKLHLLFKKAHVKKGDKIALIGRNNPRWCITYIAAITYGACIVPILQDFNPNDIIHIINHSESRLLFLGDTYWDVIEEDQIPHIEAVFSLTDFHVVFEREGKVLGRFVDNITKNYRAKYPSGFRISDIKYADVPNDQVILLNYTSGTTGHSKGVMLTVNNLTANVEFALQAVNRNGELYFGKGVRTLSFLPLAHAYGCAFDFLSPLAAGGHITLLGKIPSPKILIEAMQFVKPTIVCCVPLILEKIYRKQVLPALEKGPVSIAMKIPLLNTAIYSSIRSKLMNSFGGNVKLFIVGGAPMNNETEAFLMKINFPITIGYGMTECAPLISFAPDHEFKPGSCGKYIKGYIDAKIDSPDPQNVAGEILVKGENVMLGYYKNEQDTKNVLQADGWLHTGDMGTMDPDGTIYIRGRSKTMILTGSGQNIYPEEIEDKLNNMYLVLESLIIENNGKLHALVVPDYEQAEKEGVEKSELPAIMAENLKQLNTLLASYEQVSNITIYPTEFEKTPKRSIKRYLYDVSLLKL